MGGRPPTGPNGRAREEQVADLFVSDFDHHSGGFLTRPAHGLEPVAPHAGGPLEPVRRLLGRERLRRGQSGSRDERVFTSEFGEHGGVLCQGIAGIPRPPGIPVIRDRRGPARVCTRLRRLLGAYLLPDAVRAMRPLAEVLTTRFIDEKIESGSMDLVHDLTNPVPAILTLHLIGLPTDQWRHYADLFHATIAHKPGTPAYDAAMAQVPAMMESLLLRGPATPERTRATTS